MTIKNYYKIQSLLLLITGFVFLASLYLQYVNGLEPCPLCLMQRLCVFLLLLLLSVSLKLNYSRSLCGGQFVIAAAGLFFSLRHLWLQSLPSTAAPACMPGLDVLIHYFPWQTVAQSLLWGTGDCAESSWNFLGITLPGWSALYFLCVLVLSSLMCCRVKKEP